MIEEGVMGRWGVSKNEPTDMMLIQLETYFFGPEIRVIKWGFFSI